jgi:alkaline phosphatase
LFRWRIQICKVVSHLSHWEHRQKPSIYLDDAATENRTFQAVNDAIGELAELVRKAQMQFNTSTVIVTADHGFLFQQSKLKEADRTSIAEKPANYIKSKTRYDVGQNIAKPKDALYGSTRVTAGTEADTKFWVPKRENQALVFE